jgi:hypothetical protein
MDAEQIIDYPLKMVKGAAFPCDAAVREIFFHFRVPRSPERRRLGVKPYQAFAPFGNEPEHFGLRI